MKELDSLCVPGAGNRTPKGQILDWNARSSDPARLEARPESLKNKRRRELCSGRLGSPPPELPNHEWIVRPVRRCVNVTLVILSFGE